MPICLNKRLCQVDQNDPTGSKKRRFEEENLSVPDKVITRAKTSKTHFEIQTFDSNDFVFVENFEEETLQDESQDLNELSAKQSIVVKDLNSMSSVSVTTAAVHQQTEVVYQVYPTQ